MNKAYRKIFAYVLALAVLFVALTAIPKDWHVKTGMSGVEYDQAWQKANDRLTKAEAYGEKRAAATETRGLYNYKKEGHIDEVKDMGWMLYFIRFALIAAILTLCFVTTKLIIKEVRRLNSSDGAAKSSATGR